MNASRIAELRRARGWTQEQLSSASGVAVRTIQRLESGTDASAETLTLIANALDVPVGDLFARVGTDDFGATVDGLEARRRAQQERRDATTEAASRLFTGIGILVVFGTLALAYVTHGTMGWLVWLIIPAYWAAGRYLFRAFFRIVIDPRLDERYPLSLPTRRSSTVAREPVVTRTPR
ncbi:helix-turn-helix domain-containing protein [Gryllotalpicola daejeonensis]|uniref:Helix-turn-helix domain-containing protein n=1 Tax=Gryllotalpicola daejeonensis TaxID=993087 RepID=A0ABP7ZII1_9MICO